MRLTHCSDELCEHILYCMRLTHCSSEDLFSKGSDSLAICVFAEIVCDSCDLTLDGGAGQFLPEVDIIG